MKLKLLVALSALLVVFSKPVSASFLCTDTLTFQTLHICDGDSAFLGGAYQTVADTYYDTLIRTGGCDSVISTDLIVNPVYSLDLFDTLCHGDSSFILGYGFPILATGDYTVSLSSVSACDSTIELHLYYHPHYSHIVTDTICNGDSSFVLGFGFAADSSGSYPFTFSSVSGCDSLVTLDLTYNPTYAWTYSDTVCFGDTLHFAGHHFTGTSNDTLLFSSVDGCDSIVYVELFERSLNETVQTSFICPGDSFLFEGSYYYHEGHYSNVFTAADGCDSLSTLHLSYYTTYNDTIRSSFCPGATFTYGSIVLTSVGSYFYALTGIHGCDSLIDIELSSPVAPIVSEAYEICDGDSIYFNGSYYTLGSYTVHILGHGGCDSIIYMLDVEHLAPAVYNYSDTICTGGSITIAGVTFTTAGLHTVHLTSHLGCDSTINLNLYVVPATGAEIYTYSDTVLAGLDVYFGTSNHSTDVSWSFSDGFSSTNDYVFHAFATPGTYTVNAIIKNDAGCYVTDVITIIVLPFTDTLSGIHTIENTNISLYPNPATDMIRIELQGTWNHADLIISDVTGKQVAHYKQLSFTNGMSIDVSNLPAGIYQMNLIDQKGNIRANFVKK